MENLSQSGTLSEDFEIHGMGHSVKSLIVLRICHLSGCSVEISCSSTRGDALVNTKKNILLWDDRNALASKEKEKTIKLVQNLVVCANTNESHSSLYWWAVIRLKLVK